jgi:hypothetical protein
MTKNEMLEMLDYKSGDQIDVHQIIMILQELVNKLPNEAPKLERGPNVNLQD